MRSKQYIDANNEFLSLDKDSLKTIDIKGSDYSLVLKATDDFSSYYKNFHRALYLEDSNLNVGQLIGLYLGKGGANRNTGYVGYVHKDNDSTKNYLTVSMSFADYILNVTGERKVGINTTDPSEALDVNGNIKLSGTINGHIIGGNNRNDIVCFTNFPSFSALHNYGYIKDEDYSSINGTKYDIYLKALLDYLFDTEPDKRNYFGIAVPGNETLVMINKYMSANEKYASGLGINYGVGKSKVISFGYAQDKWYYNVLGVNDNNSVSLDDLREVLTPEQISKLETNMLRKIELNN